MYLKRINDIKALISYYSGLLRICIVYEMMGGAFYWIIMNQVTMNNKMAILYSAFQCWIFCIFLTLIFIFIAFIRGHQDEEYIFNVRINYEFKIGQKKNDKYKNIEDIVQYYNEKKYSLNQLYIRNSFLENENRYDLTKRILPLMAGTIVSYFFTKFSETLQKQSNEYIVAAVVVLLILLFVLLPPIMTGINFYKMKISYFEDRKAEQEILNLLINKQMKRRFRDYNKTFSKKLAKKR